MKDKEKIQSQATFKIFPTFKETEHYKYRFEIQKLETKKRKLRDCNILIKELNLETECTSQKIKTCLSDIETGIKNNIYKLNSMFKNCDAHDLRSSGDSSYVECTRCGFRLKTSLLGI